MSEGQCAYVREKAHKQRIAKGAGGTGATSKIVKKCQKFFDTFFRQFSRRAKNVKSRQKSVKNIFEIFSTIFARHQFSGPFWGALAHKHKQIFPVTARTGGVLPTGWGGGGLPTGGQGSKVYVLCAEPKEHKRFLPGTRPGGIGLPAGRIGDRGDREIVYVPNVYVSFPAPSLCSAPQPGLITPALQSRRPSRK